MVHIYKFAITLAKPVPQQSLIHVNIALIQELGLAVDAHVIQVILIVEQLFAQVINCSL